MIKNDLAAWFFEGGSVSLPKKLIGLSETLGLDFKDLGQISYIMYCDCLIEKDDKYSMTAARALKRKSLIDLQESGEAWQISFSPMFQMIEKKLGLNEKTGLIEDEAPASQATYADAIKRIEQELAIFLTVREKMEIQEVVQNYLWDYPLVAQMFINYHKNFKRQYPFKFYCKMAFGNNVSDLDSLNEFHENTDRLDYKIAEVKKRLGHRRTYSEVEKEAYLKWTNLWKFSHEMVLFAVDQTLSAKDPSFKYLDVILENWFKDSVKNKEDFIKREEEFTKNKLRPGDKKPKVSSSEVRDLNSFIE